MILKKFNLKIKNNFKYKAKEITVFDLKKKKIPLYFFAKKYCKKV